MCSLIIDWKFSFNCAVITSVPSRAFADLTGLGLQQQRERRGGGGGGFEGRLWAAVCCRCRSPSNEAPSDNMPVRPEMFWRTPCEMTSTHTSSQSQGVTLPTLYYYLSSPNGGLLLKIYIYTYTYRPIDYTLITIKAKVNKLFILGSRHAIKLN